MFLIENNLFQKCISLQAKTKINKCGFLLYISAADALGYCTAIYPKQLLAARYPNQRENDILQHEAEKEEELDSLHPRND